jgi:hypothetical protein
MHHHVIKMGFARLGATPPRRLRLEVSGHSTRVGAAQDLAELDTDLAAITQAGGWKSTRMPLKYAEKINAGRGREWRERRPPPAAMKRSPTRGRDSRQADP